MTQHTEQNMDDENEVTDGTGELPESPPLESKPKLKERIKAFVKKIKTNLLTLYLAFFEVAWYKKAFIFLLLIYAFSPIELIPDFITILGFLDDLIILPLGVVLCRLMIPKDIWSKCKEQVESGVKIKKSFKIHPLNLGSNNNRNRFCLYLKQISGRA